MNKTIEKLKVKIHNLIKELKGDIIVSDLFDYNYDNANQKEIKQLYPNNDGVDVILGFRENDNIIEGHRVSHSLVKRQVPIEKEVYILDDTFIFDTRVGYESWQSGTLHGLLKVVSIRRNLQSLEILNRWLRTHEDTLWKSSPTEIDKYGDCLHDGLLVVEHDKQACVPQELLLRCRHYTISRIAIVETPWTQEVVKKNGNVRIKQGVDRRLHVYIIPVDIERAEKRIEHDLEVSETARKLKDFIS